jgi:FkbM family methyltransferase
MNWKSEVAEFVRARPIIYRNLRRAIYLLKHHRAPPKDALWELSELVNRRNRLVFVQIGANDGKSSDLIFGLVKRFKWSGLLVEPLPDLFARLKKNYEGNPGLIFECAAIAESIGERTLYRLKNKEGAPSLPLWADGLGSFSKDVIMRHTDLIPNIGEYLVMEQVAATPLMPLIEKHAIDKIDLLLIDAEGYDYQVLKQADLKTLQPDLIIYESKHLSSEDRAKAHVFLYESGYRFEDNGENTVARKVRDPK